MQWTVHRDMRRNLLGVERDGKKSLSSELICLENSRHDFLLLMATGHCTGSSIFMINMLLVVIDHDVQNFAGSLARAMC